jgi:hypothetical protein
MFLVVLFSAYYYVIKKIAEALRIMIRMEGDYFEGDGGQ